MKKVKQACIIDDDAIFVYGAKRLMMSAQICSEFLVFQNGKDAIDGLTEINDKQEPLPELILLDLNMPIMDGWQFLEEFVKLETKGRVTLYIVSSSIDPADIAKAKQYEEVSNFVVKPITSLKLMKLFEG
jgi:CheY-like chemotaxis protein